MTAKKTSKRRLKRHTVSMTTADAKLRAAFPVDRIVPITAEARARFVRWQHENVVAEMVNGLRWLSDTDWFERRSDGFVTECHGN